jgi:hypothetical protein
MQRADILLIPGFGNSGPAHWQSLWEEALPSARRVALGDWDSPTPERWIARLDAAIVACAEPPVLVAHSLGVIAVASWAALSRAPVRAALLVAPPDMDRTDLPAEVRAFGAPSLALLRFAAVVAASSTDPFCTSARSRALAEAWGAGFVDLGDAGHVNTASGHGPWPVGEQLLASMMDARGV